VLRHPECYRDLRRLTNGIREALPHRRLFFMVIMPGSLHVAQLAYQFVPDDVRLVAILNNTDDWEQAWARRNLKRALILTTRFSYPHHALLNLLLRCTPQPFGILDFDCFVFRPEYFGAVEAIGPTTSAQVFYANHNTVLDLWVPETFLLILNQPVLADLVARYRVGTDGIAWDDLSSAVQRRLATLGIGPDQLPENYKPSFDTTRVLLMLALAEGYPYEIITRHSAAMHLAGDIFHVGASSSPKRDLQGAHPYALWGTYFWIRRLELIDDQELRDKYLPKYGIVSSENVSGHLGKWLNQEIRDYIDTIASGRKPEVPVTERP
jgi:hypothetical protein